MNISKIYSETCQTSKKKLFAKIINGHCGKGVQIRRFFWSVFFCICTEYGGIRTRKNSVFGHFLCSGLLQMFELVSYSSTGICCTPVGDNFKVIDVLLLLSVINEVTSKHITQSLQSEYVDPGI